MLCGMVALAAAAGLSAGPSSDRTEPLFEPEEFLMSVREGEIFRALQHPRVRERFLEHFWSQRAPEVRADWNKRLPLASSEFADLTTDRARLFLTAGPPRYRLADICPVPVNPHEIWSYGDGGEGPGNEERKLVFVAEQAGSTFEIWRPGDWKSILAKAADGAGDNPSESDLLASCARGEELLAALSGSEAPVALPGLNARDPAWVEEFLAQTTLLPVGAQPLEATVAVGYPAAVGDRTAVLVTLEIPDASVPVRELRDFSLTGEIFGTRAIDAFRLQLSAAGRTEEEPLRLTVRRHLPPGEYSMVLKLHDLTDDRYLRTTVALDVLNILTSHADLSARLGTVIFSSFTASIILWHVLREDKITSDTLFGAVCAYLLIGHTWTTLYMLLEVLHPGSFYVGTAQNPDHMVNISDLSYFSIVTLTTLGYGDITPVTSTARSFAALEALFGVMYNAILIARLVGLYRPMASSTTTAPAS